VTEPCGATLIVCPAPILSQVTLLCSLVHASAPLAPSFRSLLPCLLARAFAPLARHEQPPSWGEVGALLQTAKYLWPAIAPKADQGPRPCDGRRKAHGGHALQAGPARLCCGHTLGWHCVERVAFVRVLCVRACCLAALSLWHPFVCYKCARALPS